MSLSANIQHPANVSFSQTTACVVYFNLSAEPASLGHKAARKTSLAGGARLDLEKVAQQQQIKLQEQMERILTSVKATQGGHTRENDREGAGERNTTGGTSRKQQAHIRSAQTEPNRLAGTQHLCQGNHLYTVAVLINKIFIQIPQI